MARTTEENAMKTSQRPLSAGWSFAAGTLFGALAAFVLPASLPILRPTAESPKQPGPIAVESPGSPSAPAGIAPAFVRESDPAARSAGASARRQQPTSSSRPKKLKGHSELDLQLD